MTGNRLSDEETHRSTTSRQWTRREALAIAGSGLFAGAVGSAQAASYDARVYESSGTFYAENGGSTVYNSGDFLDTIQAAVDSLSTGRSSKERVLVEASGQTGSHAWDGDVKAVDLPSYTVLDVPGTISVNDTGDDLIVPVRAENVTDIEVPRLNVTGNPRYGMWIKSCTNVSLGDIWMSLPTAESVGLGVRIDDSGGSGRTNNVTLDSAFVEDCTHHAVETYGVDGIDIGTVETQDTGGCGLLLNDTSDATVDTVDAVNPDPGGGYAGFRVANGAGPNITVQNVTVRGGARGIFGVSGSHDFTIESVDIEGTDVQGILIQDCQNANVNGGTVRNNDNEAVRIDSRDADTHDPASNVTVQNLRVVDDRANKQQTYGIYETGPDTNNNAILNNDLRDGGTIAELSVYAASTTVQGNTTS